MSATPPSGTVTFLFTDIEGSTRRWEEDTQGMALALARHNQILGSCIGEHRGYVVKTEGDAFFAVFSTALDGLDCALSAQSALHTEPWAEGREIRVRMALHTGSAEERDGDYFGPPVNRAARLMAAAHGGQILLSRVTTELVRDALPAGIALRDLGEHQLKDLYRPEHIFQAVAPDLPCDFPALRTLDHRPTNLPVQSTPFLGRERELAAIVERLNREDVRLLTLTGPGGTGKTRLALQTAADVLDRYLDGAFFVPLAEITDPALVTSALAQALGVQGVGGQPLLTTVREHLKGKSILLVLDNFERLLDAAEIVSELLAGCPALNVLVTSRIPLHVTGEHEYPVPGLSLPDVRRLPPVEQISQYDAVALFIERAQAVKPEFQVTNANAPAVAEICHRLDGLPLAIELAAARIKLFPAPALLQRLSSRLQILTGGAKDRPDRQRTLRGAIDWSYSLLSDGDRTLFARLSVFAGGCTFEAAEAVCNADGRLDLLEGIASLVDKSLLRQEGEDEPRFVMLETLREYGDQRLAEFGEQETVRQRHAEHMTRLAEEAEPALTGSEQSVWLERLEQEQGNIRAALAWGLEAKSELAMRLASALWFAWYMHGRFAEGRRWLEAALAMPGSQGRDVALRAKALNRAGALAEKQGDYRPAREFCAEALRLRQEIGDKGGVAASLKNLGMIAVSQADYARARELYEEALRIFREVRDTVEIAGTLNNIGTLVHMQGEYDQAKAHYEECLPLMREAGHRWGCALVLNNLGGVAEMQGDYQRAEQLHGESLRFRQELGDRWGIADSLGNLGFVAQRQGDHQRAAELHRESLKLNAEQGEKSEIAVSLEGLAAVACSQHEPDRAAQLLGAADAIRSGTGAVWSTAQRQRMEPVCREAQAALSAAAYAAAWNRGKAMSLEEAVAFALHDGLDRRPPLCEHVS